MYDYENGTKSTSLFPQMCFHMGIAAIPMVTSLKIDLF